MKQLIYKANLRHNRMPEWLLWILTVSIGSFQQLKYNGQMIEYQLIQQAIENDLTLLEVKSFITTELVTDEDETVIFIKSGGRILVSIYIK